MIGQFKELPTCLNASIAGMLDVLPGGRCISKLQRSNIAYFSFSTPAKGLNVDAVGLLELAGDLQSRRALPLAESLKDEGGLYSPTRSEATV